MVTSNSSQISLVKNYFITAIDTANGLWACDVEVRVAISLSAIGPSYGACGLVCTARCFTKYCVLQRDMPGRCSRALKSDREAPGDRRPSHHPDRARGSAHRHSCPIALRSAVRQ